MKKIRIIALIFISIMTSINASATLIADADLNSYIQKGTITNDINSDSAITSIVYSLGTAADGIATWDTGTAGGVASDFLSSPAFFQTVTWSGLNILAGNNFSFANLDIDLIETILPLSVTGSILDNIGTSLVNASLTVFWGNVSASVELTQQAWSTSQSLSLRAADIPEPTSIALLGLALIGMSLSRKKKA